MDVSDGLVIDLNKLINKQKLGYLIDIDKIPISNQLKQLIKRKKLKKLDYLFNGDDYQILFTSSKSNRDKIDKISKITKTKISRIGKILTKKKFKFRLLNADKVLKFTKIPGYEHFFT